MSNVVKKYTIFTNWDEFPELKGLKINDGNLHRTACSCGYTYTGVISKCPNCGNETFRGTGRTHYEYEIVDLNKFALKRIRVHYSYAKTDLPATKIVKPMQAEVFYLYNTSHPFTDVLEALPALHTTPEIQMATILRNHLVAKRLVADGDSWYVNSHWSTIFRFCHKLMSQKPDITSEQLISSIQFLYRGDVISKMNTLLSYNCNLYAKLNSLARISPAVSIMARDLSVFRELIVDHNRYSKIDPAIAELIAAYYADGYIRDVKYLMDIIEHRTFNDDSRRMFIKFFKDIYPDPGVRWSKISTMLSDIDAGMMFENTKSYYLQKNYKKFAHAYGIKKVNAAFEDIYQHPADCLIALVNS